MILRLCVTGAVLLAVCGSPSLRAQPVAEDTAIVERLCRACHLDKFEGLEHNPHTVLADQE